VGSLWSKYQETVPPLTLRMEWESEGGLYKNGGNVYFSLKWPGHLFEYFFNFLSNFSDSMHTHTHTMRCGIEGQSLFRCQWL
jgi:hypothetical protein